MPAAAPRAVRRWRTESHCTLLAWVGVWLCGSILYSLLYDETENDRYDSHMDDMDFTILMRQRMQYDFKCPVQMAPCFFAAASDLKAKATRSVVSFLTLSSHASGAKIAYVCL